MSDSHTPPLETGPGTRVGNHRPAYDGGVRELLPIVLINAILGFVTLGIYRFWAKTRVRRYFLSRISFLGDRLTYTGTGKELFIGFLIVLAVIIPFSMAFQALSFWTQGQGWGWFGLVNAVYFAAFYYLFHFAVFRANRYRLSRINWRGIRAGQTGSAVHYANLAVLYSLLVLLTLGLAYPLMRNRLQAYKISHASFGSECLSYHGETAPLFRRWLVPWGVFVGTMLAGAMWGQLGNELSYPQTLDGSMTDADFMKNMSNRSGATAGFAFLLLYLAMFWYRAAEVRHFTNHTRFADLRFVSTLRGVQFLLVYVTYGAVLALLVAPGIFLALAAGTAALSEGIGSEGASAIGAVVAIIYLLAFFLFAGLLQTLIIQNMLLRAFCRELTISGHISPERLLQSQLAAPTRGEGLADALDIDAF